MNFIVKIWNNFVKWFRKTFLGWQYIETKTPPPTMVYEDHTAEEKRKKIHRKVAQKSRRINRLWEQRKG